MMMRTWLAVVIVAAGVGGASMTASAWEDASMVVGAPDSRCAVLGAGINEYGQLGNPDWTSEGTTDGDFTFRDEFGYTLDLTQFVLPDGLVVEHVETFGSSVVVISSDGRMFYAGANESGQAGNGTTDQVDLPHEWQPAGVVVDRVFSAPLRGQIYALADDGTLYAAGGNDFPALGVGTAPNPVTAPAEVVFPAGAAPVSDVMFVPGGVAFVLTDGSLYAVRGALGNVEPVPVPLGLGEVIVTVESIPTADDPLPVLVTSAGRYIVSVGDDGTSPVPAVIPTAPGAQVIGLTTTDGFTWTVVTDAPETFTWDSFFDSRTGHLIADAADPAGVPDQAVDPIVEVYGPTPLVARTAAGRVFFQDLVGDWYPLVSLTSGAPILAGDLYVGPETFGASFGDPGRTIRVLTADGDLWSVGQNTRGWFGTSLDSTGVEFWDPSDPDSEPGVPIGTELLYQRAVRFEVPEPIVGVRSIELQPSFGPWTVVETESGALWGGGGADFGNFLQGDVAEQRFLPVEFGLPDGLVLEDWVLSTDGGFHLSGGPYEYSMFVMCPETGSIELTKSVSGDAALPPEGWMFTLSSSNCDVAVAAHTVAASGGTITIEDLVVNSPDLEPCLYEIAEVAVDGWTATVTPSGPFSIQADTAVSVAAVNESPTTTITTTTTTAPTTTVSPTSTPTTVSPASTVPPTPAATLPDTGGGDVGPTWWIGLLCLCVGVGFLVASRRRPTAW